MRYEITPPAPRTPPPPPGSVILCWIRKAQYFEDGYAYPRAPGQEDVMARGEALKYVSSGQGVIVGPADHPSRYACPPEAEGESAFDFGPDPDPGSGTAFDFGGVAANDGEV